ncbi:integrase arm-type DNA-binding domain-containing protein [Pasteurella canis]|uniref:tyrosine-type recombinase/integrase n=1 Tax=Pasteurella canis TaxID=753 RepID=UPI001D12516C|nr:integrase arm-type DNA-binding domain-containing protein [Pasteurella canis]UDW84067.1 integrase arm-type DNA-binding domain-containing protein [Pasteurella canis]
MARIIKRLTNTEVEKVKAKDKEYTLADGDGLFLLVLPSGTKSWRFNYYRPFTGKRTKCSLGSYPAVSLSQARTKREEYRALLAQNIDPQQEEQRLQQEAESRIRDTFYVVAESYFNGIYQSKAKNPETREKNWKRLENHIFPHIGNIPVSEVNTKLLVRVYTPIAKYSNTLKKLHQLVGAIMDHAITQGIIDSHNCRLAVKNFHIKPSKPNPTIKIDELAQLFDDLNKANLSIKTYLLICWSFLTALRPKEAVNAQWQEIDFQAKLWHIPKERMKGQEDKKRPHIVPLSSQALHLLEIMRTLSGNSHYVFRGRTLQDKPMSQQTVNSVLKRNGYQNRLTAHGIRAFIKTFLASKRIERNVSETVLSHLLEGGDDLENTYNRYDYLEERIPVMQLIGDYCESCGMFLYIDSFKE